MNLGRHWRLMLALVSLGVGGGVWWYSVERSETPLATESADLESWRRVGVQSMKWSSEELWSRRGGMKWSVEYEYHVDGTTYRGHNINARLTAIRVRYGEYPIGMFSLLHQIKSVWYDPKTPSRSAVFKSTGTDITSEMREAYVELMVQAIREGKWP